MKYRKKPVVIEAIRVSDDWSGWPQWALEAERIGVINLVPSETPGKCDVIIKTLEGKMRGNLDDFIIQGVKGEIYPCKPDIFAATYELVE